jgi:hypothetical protein
MTTAKSKVLKKKYEGSKVDKYLDKKLGYKEDSKKDEKVDKHMAKLLKEKED